MARKKTEEPEPEPTVAEALAEAAVPPKKPEYLETKEVTVTRGDEVLVETIGKRFVLIRAEGREFMQEKWDVIDSKPAKPIRVPVVEESVG